MSGEPEEPGEKPAADENPDPENGSEFCVAENEQTEADQATAAVQSESLYINTYIHITCQLHLEDVLLYAFIRLKC